MPANKLFNYPHNAFLMIRFEFVVICQDELEAKLLRIIESYVDEERKRIYAEMVNASKSPITPDQVVEIEKDIWVPISHRLFMNDLFGVVTSANTIKRALQSLISKHLIFTRFSPQQRYDAPEYRLNTTLIQMLLDVVGKPGYQNLIPSVFDTIKDLPPQELTPSGYQELIVSSQLRVSNFDTNIRSKNNKNRNKKDTYGATASASHSAPTNENSSHSSQEEETLQDDDVTGLHRDIQPPVGNSIRDRVLPSQDVAHATSPTETVTGALSYSPTRQQGRGKIDGPGNDVSEHHVGHHRHQPDATHADRVSPALCETLPQGTATTQQRASTNHSAHTARDEQPEQSNSPKSGEVPTGLDNPVAVGGKEVKPARKPKPPKETPEMQSRINAVFDCLDQLAQETSGNSDFTYARKPQRSRDAIKDMLQGRVVSPEKLRLVYMEMWDTPAGRDGFQWKDNMSVVAICRHYDEKLLSAMTKLKAPKPKPQQSSLYACSSGQYGMIDFMNDPRYNPALQQTTGGAR